MVLAAIASLLSLSPCGSHSQTVSSANAQHTAYCKPRRVAGVRATAAVLGRDR